MGQEIGKTEFTGTDFAEFGRRLAEETALLSRMVRTGQCSDRGPVTGFELEAWLVDDDMNPAPMNAEFLAALNSPLAGPELARFNVEFNNEPRRLTGAVLSDLHADLDRQWAEACRVAEELGLGLVAIGILPTVRAEVLNLGNLSPLNRYRALNEQLLSLRSRQPLRLDIAGREHLQMVHGDVMLEAATTSFQIHLQVPLADVGNYFNAAILASAPLVGVACNSPFLFGHDLWAETRIPVFELVGDVAERGGEARLGRVGFGSGYARSGLDAVFEENLHRFPVVLPIVSDQPPESFAHLRLHNGTIWRWNRPLVGFDPDGAPHLRIEHRVIPAGPSLADMVANAAFFYGLAESLAEARWDRALPFAAARDNFYRAAREGLSATLTRPSGEPAELRDWILAELLPLAHQGLSRLGLAEADAARYLGIIEERTASGRTGTAWQRAYLERRPGDFAGMTRTYSMLQQTGDPVHRWPP